MRGRGGEQSLPHKKLILTHPILVKFIGWLLKYTYIK